VSKFNPEAMFKLLAAVREEKLRNLKDGEPCDHVGCLAHVTHPCEGCGRIAGRRIEPSPTTEGGEQ
jgi:hypothetical protein